MLDLMQIARTEADGGDLFGLLSDLFETGDITSSLVLHNSMKSLGSSK